MPEPSAATTRRRVLLVFGVVGLLGFGGGAAANQLMVARLLALPEDAELPDYVDADVPARADAEPSEPGEPPRPSAPKAPRVPSLKQYTEAIVRRNIFDSTAVYDPNAAKEGDPAGECKSDANVRLLATVVADPPTYSSALIVVGSARDGKADGYAIGDDVSGEGRITLSGIL